MKVAYFCKSDCKDTPTKPRPPHLMGNPIAVLIHSSKWPCLEIIYRQKIVKIK